MDLERKVELMKRSYLGGYAATFCGMDADVFSFTQCDSPISKEKGERMIGRLYETYQSVQDHYDKVVPFYGITQEMNSDDWDDFALLFRVREVLPKFRRFIDEYAGFLRKNNYHSPEGSEPVRIFRAIWVELYEAERYNGLNLKKRICRYDPTSVSPVATERPKM